MQAYVNESCIGCGLCTGICPGVFAMTDEGVARAKDEVPSKLKSQVREAAASCPVDAIETEK